NNIIRHSFWFSGFLLQLFYHLQQLRVDGPAALLHGFLLTFFGGSIHRLVENELNAVRIFDKPLARFCEHQQAVVVDILCEEIIKHGLADERSPIIYPKFLTAAEQWVYIMFIG